MIEWVSSDFDVRICFLSKVLRDTLKQTSNPGLLFELDYFRAKPNLLGEPATVDASILLVETDADTLKTMDDLFFDLGCFVDVLDTGQAALEYFRQNTPTIAILSADLSDPGGIDVCFRIKRIRRLQHMPVLILSSNDDDKTRDFAQMAKADVFLPKPLEPELLRAVIEELITRAEAQASLKNTSETVILDFNA
jgi:DNA-binding response OmpR family regulator